MPQISTNNRWGQTALFGQAGTVIAGANAVVGNFGLAIQISPSGGQRLTKLGWRVDLMPDIPAGTSVAPTVWRVVVIAAQVPQDITILQTQAFPTAGLPRPEIPAVRGGGAPFPILHDEWLNLAGAPPVNGNGLNSLALREFPDAGPVVDAQSYLSVILCPIIDANFATLALNTIQPNAQLLLEAWGETATAAAFGGAPGAQSIQGAPSLPRFATEHRGGRSNVR